ncbi:MAG: SDR family NAD(P)-dependent oxidoreductase [Coprobacillaceae bacterium]
MKTVLITGTTSGIGYELSKIYAKKKYHLILVSRSREKLLKQKEELLTMDNKVDIISFDLGKDNAADKVYQEVVKNHWHVDILINNAGFNEAGFFMETSRHKEQEMIALHVQFTTDMMKIFLPSMKEVGYGKILNIGSTGSYIASPKDAVYAATKAYNLHLSKALHAELKGTGISITTLCPGSTRTEFAKKANMNETLLFKIFVMSADKVARIGYKALQKRKSIVIPGLYNKVLVLSSKILPYSFIGWMTKKML